MYPNMHFLEKTQIVQGVGVVNLATGVNTGAWANLKEYRRCAVVFFAGAGTVGQDPTITFQQAKTVAGGSPKALNVTRFDVKEATSLAAVGLFTTTVQAAAQTVTVAGSAALQKIWVVDIMAGDLDIDNGYCCIQASVGDVGTNSQVGGVLYFLHEPRDLTNGVLPSALVN